jgi:NADH dehydrogenase
LPKDYPDLDIRRMQIHVVQGADRLLPGMSEKASVDSERFLRKMGVNIWLDIRAQDYDGTTVYTNKETFRAKTLIWTAGVKGAPTAGLNTKQTNDGRVLVNDFNQINGHKNIFAIGDVAAITSEDLPYGHPMLASVAGQQGVHLGKNFNRLAKQKELTSFVYKDRGTMATVGRNLAVVDMKRFKFGGWFAWLMWMFVHLMLLVDFRSRLVVFVNWAWSYLFYDKGTRLIVRKVKDKTVVDCKEEEIAV